MQFPTLTHLGPLRHRCITIPLPWYGRATAVSRSYHGRATIVPRPWYDRITTMARSCHGRGTIVVRSCHDGGVILWNKPYSYVIIIIRPWHGRTTVVQRSYHGRITIVPPPLYNRIFLLSLGTCLLHMCELLSLNRCLHQLQNQHYIAGITIVVVLFIIIAIIEI